MANHNVLITNPQGERKYHFHENVTRKEATAFIEEYGPAPIGWSYQIYNFNRKKRINPEHILIQGFTKDGEFIASTEARHKTNNGWYSVKMAKRDLRKQGASWFTQEKIYAVTNPE